MTALVSFDRVFEVLDLTPAVRDSKNPSLLPAGPLSLNFVDVSFTYPTAREVSLASLESVARKEEHFENEPVLQGISFEVPSGTLTAIVGPSGAGKSTISALVTRLYDVSSGSVRLGDVDVRDLRQLDLRAALGVVTQDAHLFHDTIGSNLRYAAPKATDGEIYAALESAQIVDLVRSLPNGLNTVVGDRGHRLSGGEKQRLALARVLLKSPRLLILDEATAHLDSESEAAVQRALDSALVGRTSIVIAHRLSTIRNADQILVIADGAVAERGTHDELLVSQGLYADLYRTQFTTIE
jgi:ATP-binding cassette subfamily B protein